MARDYHGRCAARQSRGVARCMARHDHSGALPRRRSDRGQRGARPEHDLLSDGGRCGGEQGGARLVPEGRLAISGVVGSGLVLVV